ncbi:hypothetical protein ABZ541_29205 [Micromonospora sediminicola]|uniref:hypothetical protein n=1 Tax=Micromonospora sediminicola TaxID=946078 RepID=UPI00340AB294
MNAPWAGHWHGFGPWAGPREEFAKEHLRRPSTDPTQHREFLTNTMTPTQLGASLLRVQQASAERTWTDVDAALDWFATTWKSNPPGGDVLTLEDRLAYSRDSLLRGSDICAGYYTPGFTFVSYSIVCCPNPVFFPDVSCPRPPR